MKLLAGFEMGKISLMLDLVGVSSTCMPQWGCRQASKVRIMIACMLVLALAVPNNPPA
jgi:hypothetical protein